MTKTSATKPLTAREEKVWRSFIRLMVQLPRVVDEDMLRRSGLSLTRYVVLMQLSEAPRGSRRMSDLAHAVAISPSRVTRIVQSMVNEGLVARQVDQEDARASLAVLTDAGLDRLRAAWPAHLASVRTLVLDHLDADDQADLLRISERLLAAVGDSTP
jgi:DNA-binding MarR family transcriptional regulator